LPDPTENSRSAEDTEPFLMRCPNCQRTVIVRDMMCPRCGFPFYWELADAPPVIHEHPLSIFTRVGLVAAMLAFIMYFTVGSVTQQEGYTTVAIKQLVAAGLPVVPIPVTGDKDFQMRTQLALALLKQRAPSYYSRFLNEVKGIDYVPKGIPTKSWRAVAAFTDDVTKRVYVRIPAVYSSGFGELFDRDVFYYASVLVHEMRHLELARVGLSVGGLAEEYECEETAYAALKRMDAPKPLLIELQRFLDNPGDQRYKQWLQFYKENPQSPPDK
jgi:hypothetical protein